MGETPRVPSPLPVRVVIADDDRLFARMLRTRLNEQPDIEVVGMAEDGRRAVTLVEEFEPDLVVMDVNMPVMDGVEATRRIRALESPPSVVMITGEDDDADARAYEAGAAAYVRKSGDLVALIDVIVAFSHYALGA
jgi:DNA-binding NarL/FixJ family response regulator